MLTRWLFSGLLAAQFAAFDVPARISQEEFRKLRDTGNVVVVDTRNAEAYAQGHIAGAVLLPLEGLQIWPREYESVAVMLQGANKPIVTYCA